ncbi:MAG: hypothetical protein IKW74_04125, partial [Thermoguttaceae bacterium]|nr:hypothetical protein [Thermoguttaceae bacterium]
NSTMEPNMLNQPVQSEFIIRQPGPNQDNEISQTGDFLKINHNDNSIRVHASFNSDAGITSYEITPTGMGIFGFISDDYYEKFDNFGDYDDFDEDFDEDFEELPDDEPDDFPDPYADDEETGDENGLNSDHEELNSDDFDDFDDLDSDENTFDEDDM